MFELLRFPNAFNRFASFGSPTLVAFAEPFHFAEESSAFPGIRDVLLPGLFGRGERLFEFPCLLTLLCSLLSCFLADAGQFELLPALLLQSTCPYLAGFIP
ncbi:hypothetical protein D5S18_01225 [Nocardia panacis]|uniref:Uncharacterized protein n=1 Tax=Nocardia panacis TaxID=2340916 RepID=A0A3A4L0I2_9NOCA|nr:hypothetical protein D5S18_01225 [Nocardia panacis]